jgi:hypothetical protein
VSWKCQHNLALRDFDRLAPKQAGALPREISAEDAGDVKERAASADEASIVGAIADDITLGTKHRVLQRYGVERPASRKSTTGILHHRTSHKNLPAVIHFHVVCFAAQ